MISIIPQLYLFVQKATMTGPISTRTEVIVTSMQDDTAITVKFWNENMQLCDDITLGQHVRAYALRSVYYKHKVCLTTTDETVVEVS